MTIASKPDLRTSRSANDAEVVIGEYWVRPGSKALREVEARHSGRRLLSFNNSPLARKIVTFNLLALVLLVAGVLFLNPFRDSLVVQHERGLVDRAKLIAKIIEQQPQSAVGLETVEITRALARLEIGGATHVFVYDSAGQLVSSTEAAEGQRSAQVEGLVDGDRSTLITDFLNGLWKRVAELFGKSPGAPSALGFEASVRALVPDALHGTTQVAENTDLAMGTLFAVATPIKVAGRAIGVVGLTSAAGEIDHLVGIEREQVLQMFVIAILVSIGLSLVLASTIANPLAELAAAAEVGRERNHKQVNPGRVRIPDLTGRSDEIGRLSEAMRGMVAALYDRIDGNEQFAADVAHEIKNPLASLRSAVGSLRFVKKREQHAQLLDVIDHDVRRLDRLVSDISNASRLDSELVKEEEQPFNLLKMLAGLAEYHSEDARSKGVEFITDLPADPIVIAGLEARLGQVFANLICNAISFCEEGDAVRVWARRRENRVLLVVEDTGPGIPEQALTKVFKRFYSDRPEGHFGNNSGLGLAISKQIVEAHGGVIWAENIRPTDADVTSQPLGARFVVGLPV